MKKTGHKIFVIVIPKEILAGFSQANPFFFGVTPTTKLHSPVFRDYNTILGVTLKEGLDGLKPSFWYDSALKTCFRVAQINCKTIECSVSTTEYN